MRKEALVAVADTADHPRETLVDITALAKRFGGVHALKSVDFTLEAGEVHALLGENGAGKSTLIKILAGVQQADGGTMEVLGRPWHVQSPAESRAAGISVVYQELSLVPSMSVADNLLLGRERTGHLGFINRRAARAEVREFLERLDVALDPGAKVDSLPFAYRQMTEICKALMGDVRVLVLDEPTSALSPGEEEVLFDAVRRVTAAGVGVIYVTHRLDEVFKLSHRVTVLRDGVSAATFTTAETTMPQLVSAIVGKGHTELRDEMEKEEQGRSSANERIATTTRPVTLELRGVVNDRLNGVDLCLHAGEIHGLAGLVGSGRTEILETVFGVRPVKSGALVVDGTPRRFRHPGRAIQAGIAMVPEDRHLEGLVLAQPLEWNVAMPYVGTTFGLSWLNRAELRRSAAAATEQFAIKTPSTRTIANRLSGGNQQKIVFAKWSSPVPKILLLDEPTAGVDVGAREEIYRLIRDIAARGTTVLVVSSDLMELMLISQRISIVRDGSVAATVEQADISGREGLHLLVQQHSTITQESA